MAVRKALLVTPDRCIGCRSCQVSCKEWNGLAAQQTQNQGSFENPADLSGSLYNRIRFVEKKGSEGLAWHFFSQRCLHCGEAACVKVCPSGALYQTSFETVAFDAHKCVGCHYCITACPFDIPRYDAIGKISKCHLCSDRIANGLEPACSKCCPTDAIQYGDREPLLRQAVLAGKRPYGADELGGLGVVYALSHPPELYGLPPKPQIPLSVTLWRDLVRPLGWVGFWGALGFTFLHYVTFGPKQLYMKHKKPQPHERTGGE